MPLAPRAEVMDEGAVRSDTVVNTMGFPSLGERRAGMSVASHHTGEPFDTESRIEPVVRKYSQARIHIKREG